MTVDAGPQWYACSLMCWGGSPQHRHLLQDVRRAGTNVQNSPPTAWQSLQGIASALLVGPAEVPLAVYGHCGELWHRRAACLPQGQV